MQIKSKGVNDEYESEFRHAMRKFVQPGDCVIDAGANRGDHVILLSSLVGENGKVIGFEPDPNAFKKLISLRLKNVVALPDMLWSEEISALLG